MEHPFRTIVKQFKAAAADGNYPRIILLTGREDFLINWAKGFIRDAVINPAAAELDCSVFSEDNCNPYDVIAACETLPLASVVEKLRQSCPGIFRKNGDISTP